MTMPTSNERLAYSASDAIDAVEAAQLARIQAAWAQAEAAENLQYDAEQAQSDREHERLAKWRKAWRAAWPCAFVFGCGFAAALIVGWPV